MTDSGTNTTAPLVFDVRGFSLDDGPGIRTTVFLKGCPLSCVWCHNPESWKTEKQLAFYPGLCIGCGDCARACPRGSASMDLPERIDRSQCIVCGICAKACSSKALKIVGREYTPDELAQELLKERLFYDTSGGGVTFSGGEPTLQMDFLGQVARLLKQEAVHVALQTSGFFDPQEFRNKVYPYVDLIYFDIKFIDESLHRRFTGVGNEKILANFISLNKERNIDIVPRTPLVPGITADQKNIDAIAKFVKSLGCVRHELLPYNAGGIAKRSALGMPAATDLPEFMMSVAEFGTWLRFVRKTGIGNVT